MEDKKPASQIVHEDPAAGPRQPEPSAPLDSPNPPSVTRVGRRGFLSAAASVTAALAAGLGAPAGRSRAGGAAAPVGLALPTASAEVLGPVPPFVRAQQAYGLRVDAAQQQRAVPLPPHPDNNDEERYATRLASYSKGLPHDGDGDVAPAAYAALLRALRSGRPEDFEAIPVGPIRLTDPQAAYAFTLEGGDPWAFAIRPAPAFASAEEQAEAAELYWQALLRDVNFTDYDTSELARAAAADLSRLSDFRGPKQGGRVTTQTLFRGASPRGQGGPYVSQLLLKDVFYGAQPFAQRNRVPVSGPQSDRLTAYGDWLAVQNGSVNIGATVYDATRRYIRNGRDLAEWVHLDFPNQAVLNAALVVFGIEVAELGQIDPAFDPNHPYLRSRTQAGFGTFGRPDALDRLMRVAVPALKAAWFQKWLVHRRLRPEEYGGRVQNTLVRGVSYPIGDELLSQSSVLGAVYARQGTYLLSQAYPEGSPTHPAYPSGHATFVGAGVTMLKAFFDEGFVIPSPVVPSADGLTLLPYTGAPLLLGGELNKLAYNVAIGRDFAGVHWRSDAEEGIRLGEAVAIRIMWDLRRLYNERFPGFTFTTFDGQTLTI